MIRLAPKKSRTYLILIFLLLAFLTTGYLSNAFGMGWNAGNSSLILGVFVLVVPLSFQLLIQFGFGDIIEFSDNEFKMLSKRGKERTYPWSGLKYYGDGNGFYMIQFGDNPALQIYAGSYSREDWSKLMNFLASHYPERKADGYVGAHLFKLNGKNL